MAAEARREYRHLEFAATGLRYEEATCPSHQRDRNPSKSTLPPDRLNTSSLKPLLSQIRLLKPPPARPAQRPLRGLHRRLRVRQPAQREHEPERRVRIRTTAPFLRRIVITSRRRRGRETFVPAGDAELEGPVQRGGAGRAGEPERCAGGRDHGEGEGVEGCKSGGNGGVGGGTLC